MNLADCQSHTHNHKTWQSVHSVQGGRDVAHHCHKEERHLKDGVFKEVKPINYAFVPGDMVHVHKQGDDP